MSNTILLIDDDESLRRVTEYNLSSAGHEMISAGSGKEGIETFFRLNPDLVITDVKLGDMNGLELLEIIKEKSPETPIIVITAFGTIEMAVEAMRRGAFNFITKPFDRDTLRLSCQKALELRTLRSQKKLLSEEVNRLTGTEGMETANSAMRDLLDKAKKVANTEATILITGESGTGKEVLARLIHQNSSRRNGPMVAVNCASIPETLIESELFGHVKGAFTGAVSDRAGRFQAASGGTLFLDEIGELKIDLQVKLLRVIQEREVEPVGSERREKIDIRIIAASNKDLQEAIAEREFREDLYYRLNVIPLYIPPLRDRKEDIPALVKHFIKKMDAPPNVRFSKKVLEKMRIYTWPGNIRELQNVVERCVILSEKNTIEETDLQLTSGSATDEIFKMEIPDEGISLNEMEKELIKKALKKSKGNRTKAAALLKIPRHVLIYRIGKYNI